jgi:hypothetical protein
MSNAFAPIVRARPNPIFGRPVHQGSPPFDYSPILLLKPFGFRIAPDTLSSGIRRATGSRSVLAVSGFRLRARLDFSIPSCSPGQRGITPAFGYSAPHPSAEGTSTPMIHALPSAHYEPLRHPKAPDLSLAGVRLVIADHAMGLPVLRTLSLCTCCRHYPGAAAGRTLRSASPSRISLPRKGRRVGLRIVLFEACSAFTRVTACTLALSPIRDTLTEGFSHFVSSMTAPVASGWSVCRVGLAPTGKRRLSTAHTQLGHQAVRDQQLI